MADKNKKEEIGKCPRCGLPVYESNKNFYCSGYKKDPKCSFAIWKEDKFIKKQTGKNISKQQAKNLLDKKQFKSKIKNGKEFGIFIMVDTGQFINYDIKLNKKKV